MVAAEKQKDESVKVKCRFARCQKHRSGNGKRGRKYDLVFVVTETAPGGPPVGTEVLRTAYADPDNLFPSPQRKSFLTEFMQTLSPDLHSPEQLMTEAWEIVLGAGAVEKFAASGKHVRWELKWVGKPEIAREVATGTAPPTSDKYDEAATKGAF